MTSEKVPLPEYYNQLPPETIKEDIEMMKIASPRELYELIMSDCKHYVSIIENYKEENLQTLFNMIVRRIEGHLMIKFSLNARDSPIEVGFLDDDNTDDETMKELAQIIKYYLDNYDKNVVERRKLIAMQIGEGDQGSCAQKTDIDVNNGSFKIGDDELGDKSNKLSEKQLQSAGYSPVPDKLKYIEKQLREGIDPRTDSNRSKPSCELKKQSAPQRGAVSLGNMNGTIPYHLNDIYSETKNNLATCGQISQLIVELCHKLNECEGIDKYYTYNFLCEIISKQDPTNLTNIIINILSEEQSSPRPPI